MSDPHPEYGPCDGHFDGKCSECNLPAYSAWCASRFEAWDRMELRANPHHRAALVRAVLGQQWAVACCLHPPADDVVAEMLGEVAS